MKYYENRSRGSRDMEQTQNNSRVNPLTFNHDLDVKWSCAVHIVLLRGTYK